MKTQVELIKQGILNEIEGYEFYRMAGDKIAEEENKNIFYEIAEEERKHAEWLQLIYKKLSNQEIIDVAFLENPPSPEIYQWTKLKADQLHTGVSIFGVAIQMEKESVAFYENAKMQVEDPNLLKLYDTLISWEQIHLEQFTNQYSIYKELWWQEQDFAPF